MRDRLIELLMNVPKLPITIGGRVNGKTYQTAGNIADHLLANGVVVPPCKSGDTLWYLDYALPKCFMSPEKIVVQDVLLINETIAIRCSGVSYNLRIEDIGKTVFLTREEAEKKLKEGKG